MQKRFLKYAVAAILATSFVPTFAADSNTESVTEWVGKDGVTKLKYEDFNYTWTNAAGETVTSNLTEKATETNQIIALLKEIYTNVNIPGTINALPEGHRMGDDDDWSKGINPSITSSNDNRAYTVEGSRASYWGLKNGDVFNPVEGQTVILIEVTDTWDGGNTSSLKDYVSKAIKSAQVLTTKIRVSDSKNPGYLYNIYGSYNRFFLLSKGGLRNNKKAGSNQPFYGMFEEMSHTGGSGISKGNKTSIYPTIASGVTYAITHDCGSVLNNKHDETLSNGWETQTDYKVNLCYYIPDNRMKYWYALNYEDASTADRPSKENTVIGFSSIDVLKEPAQFPIKYFTKGQTVKKYTNLADELKDAGLFGRDYGGDRKTNSNVYYLNYHPEFFPTIFLYTVEDKVDKVEDKRTQEEIVVDMTNGDAGKFDITLKWGSSFENKLGVNFSNQCYFIYQVVDGKIQNVPLAGPITETEYTFSDVPQEKSRQNISYIIAAAPYNDVQEGETGSEYNNVFEPVFGNVITASIPGYDPDEKMELNIAANHTSSYTYNGETNSYTNEIDMALPNLDDRYNTFKLKAAHLGVGSSFELTRFNYDNSDEASTTVATVKITRIERDPETNTNKYYYEVVDGKGNVISPEASNAPLTSAYEAEGTDLEASALVSFPEGGIKVNDNFKASTEGNDYEQAYGYKVVCNLNGGGNNYQVYSNVVKQVLPRTRYYVAPANFGSDKESTVSATTDMAIRLFILNNTNVKEYQVIRYNGSTKKVVAIARADQFGKYTVYGLDSDGKNLTKQINELPIDVISAGGDGVWSPDFIDANCGETPKYMVEIHTYSETDRVNGKDNTYGTDITEMKLPSCSASVVGNAETAYSGGKLAIKADLKVVVNDIPEGFEVASFAVERVATSGSLTFIDEQPTVVSTFTKEDDSTYTFTDIAKISEKAAASITYNVSANLRHKAQE